MQMRQNKGRLSFRLFLMSLLILGGVLYAQETAFQPGGEDFYLFQAPYLLGTGATVTGGQSIQGDILNPAFSGDVQRTTLDVNFAGILDQGAHEGLGFNLGMTLPQRYGVWTGSLNFMNSSAEAYNYGTRFGAHLSFAKAFIQVLQSVQVSMEEWHFFPQGPWMAILPLAWDYCIRWKN
jgi:hypothetical protein